MLEINQTNEDVLRSNAESGKTSSTERREGDGGSNEDTVEPGDGRIRGTVWLSCVEAVSDLTKYDWEKVFRMSAMEFFVFLAYHNYKVKKQEQEIKKIRKHR